MTARINNMVATRGSVASIQLRFNHGFEGSDLYLTSGATSYAEMLSWIINRTPGSSAAFDIRLAVDVLDQLFSVNRLDLVMHLLDDDRLTKLGIQAEAEFRLATTGHGAITETAILLVKNFEI